MINDGPLLSAGSSRVCIVLHTRFRLALTLCRRRRRAKQFPTVNHVGNSTEFSRTTTTGMYSDDKFPEELGDRLA